MGTAKQIFAEGTLPTAKRDSDGITMIDPSNIVVVEGFNSRSDFDIDDLVDSITKNGVKNPIAVVPFVDDNGYTRYKLVDGERRYRACLQVRANGGDLARIPAMMLSRSLDQKDLIVEQVLRNKQKNFNEYELGIALKKLIDLGYTPTEAYSRCSLPSWSSVYLAHLERDERVQKLMKENRISGSEVRRIYTSHKGDDKGAAEEIVNAAKKQEENGNVRDANGKKKKITIKDLDINGRTLTEKTDKIIIQGLEKIFELYHKFAVMSDGRNLDLQLDITDLYNRIQNGEHASDVFASYAEEAVRNENANEA